MKLLAAIFFATSVAMANRVVKVEVMTSNCEDCGMGPFGSLEVEVYIFHFFHHQFDFDFKHF